jgi:transposase
VIKHINEAVDQVRREEAHRLEQAGRKLLKNQRWLLLKGQEKLTPQQQNDLKVLCEQNVNLASAYILKEETRNSILIEGFFVSEEELEEVLASGNPLKKNQGEALNYYRAARFLYGLAYENYRSKKFFFGGI